MRFLTRAAVIQCNHGGFVQFNQATTSAQKNDRQVLTSDAVEDALIVGCRQNGPGQTPCSRVIEITSGRAPEAVDGQIPLSENLEFRTDGFPEGKAVIVSKSSGGSSNRSRIGIVVVGLVIVLILGGLFGAVTIISAPGETTAKDEQIRRLQKENEGLKQKQEEDRKTIERLNQDEPSALSSSDVIKEVEDIIKDKEGIGKQRDRALEALKKMGKQRDMAIKERDIALKEKAFYKRGIRAANQAQDRDAEYTRAWEEAERDLESCQRKLKDYQESKPVPSFFLQYSPCGQLPAQSESFKSRKELKKEVEHLRDEAIKKLKNDAEAKIKELEKNMPN